MTGRRTATVAVAVFVLAVAGTLLRPLLQSHDRAASPVPSAGPVAAADPTLTAAAVAAARSTVDCGNGVDDRTCSSLTVLRSDASCTAPDGCTVRLLVIVTRDASTVPVALTVAAHRNDAGHWTVGEVRS